MPALTARAFPRYAVSTSPTAIAAWTQAHMSYTGLTTYAAALSCTYTGDETNAVIVGGILSGARIVGFRNLDPDTAPGRWNYRDGIHKPYDSSPAHSAITEVIHRPAHLPGRPDAPLTGTTDSGDPLVSRGAVIAHHDRLYSGYPLDPEPEFTREPIGQGWEPITAAQWAQVSAPAPAPVP